MNSEQHVCLVLEVAGRMAQCHFTRNCKSFGQRGGSCGGSETVCDKDVREVRVWADRSEWTLIAALHRKTHGRARTAGKAGTSQVDHHRDHQSLPSLHHVSLVVIYPHQMWLPWSRQKA